MKKNLEDKRKMFLSHLWDNIKITNIHITGFLAGEERGKGAGKTFFDEIMANI